MSIARTRLASTRTLTMPILLVALLGSAAVATAAERTWSQTYDLRADGRVSIENINGDVEIRGVDGNQVIVEAVITSRSQQAADAVEIEVDASTSRIEIRTEYPNNRSWRNQSASVQYTLQVPRGAELDEISLVNGSLEITGITGEVSASLVNGNLTAEGLGGSVEFETVNGSLEVRFDRLARDQEIELDSVNGSIELYLPASIDATVSAETLHGRIRNDFGLEVDKSGYVGRELQGRIGDGGARISIDSVNGSIAIRSN